MMKMLVCRIPAAATLLLISISLPAAEPLRGATVPWTTYEAEEMTLTAATVLGPPPVAATMNRHLPQTPEMEASCRRCVQLEKAGSSVQFAARAAANAMVVRYCLPDSADGAGLDSSLALFVNGKPVATLPVTSRYSWRYGAYPFVNDPAKGTPRNFYDELRLKGLAIRQGDLIRIVRTDPNTACMIDLVDLEEIAAPLTAPGDSLDVTSPAYGADPQGAVDATEAFRKCIRDAKDQSKVVWIPPGNFLMAGDLNVPENLTIRGAGMWQSTLVGDPAKYNLPQKAGTRQRVRINGGGSNIHLADFAIIGRLNYRSDEEANDGIVQSFGTGSTIERLWVEHTKVGAWIDNSSGLVVEGCRFRNTIADGINFCVGMRGCTVQNCTARGTGDDGFAIWPATHAPQKFAPGLNVIKNCTGSLCSLGNGVGIYGGEGNTVQDSVFLDVPFGCGILVSGTFPIGENKFAGTTLVQRCEVRRCGGFDSGWGHWRGALTICPQHNDISGLKISQVTIADSLSHGVQFTNAGSVKTLTQAAFDEVTISKFGLAVLASSKTARGDGVYGVVAQCLGGVDFTSVKIDGAAITRLPTTGDSMKLPAQSFVVKFPGNSGKGPR